MIGSPPDADCGGETEVAQLVHHIWYVNAAGDLDTQADAPGFGDVGRDDPRIGLPGEISPGQFEPTAIAADA